jgi:hypothetical protein
VRSSPVGRKVYERVGFEVVRRERGFDRWIPDFREEVRVMGEEEEAKGCWKLCWQPDGTDYLERARRRAEEERAEVRSDEKEMDEATAISIT